MKECVDEEILQSYFDGELSRAKMETVSAHISSCLACRRAAHEIESESQLLAEALRPEFSLGVPTERLRHRIDAAIAKQRLVSPVRTDLLAGSAVSIMRRLARQLADYLTLSPPRAFGYAGLAVVVLFAITFALLRSTTAPTSDTGEIAATSRPALAALPSESPNDPRAMKPGSVPGKLEPAARHVAISYRPKRAPLSRANSTVESDHVKLLPGERSYLKTIAVLDTSLKSDGNLPMRPALQSEYERNLAMLDRTIAATRNAAKSNPNDPDAAEFMYTAYQTKVDFLNQVADSRLSNRRR